MSSDTGPAHWMHRTTRQCMARLVMVNIRRKPATRDERPDDETLTDFPLSVTPVSLVHADQASEISYRPGSAIARDPDVPLTDQVRAILQEAADETTAEMKWRSRRNRQPSPNPAIPGPLRPAVGAWSMWAILSPDEVCLSYTFPLGAEGAIAIFDVFGRQIKT